MKKLYLKLLQCGFAVVALTLLLQQSPVASARDHDVTILPPSSHPYGRSYEEWSNAWWQWAYSIPTHVNPVVDKTGENCDERQEGLVWFLAGTFGGASARRHCTVPQGKALFFPLANSESDNIGFKNPYTVRGLRKLLEPFFTDTDPNAFSVHIDGEAIHNLGKYKAGLNGPAFSFFLPKDNVYQLASPASPYPSKGIYSPVISCGYYLMLAPLPPGEHKIDFKVGTQEVKYYLHIKRR